MVRKLMMLPYSVTMLAAFAVVMSAAPAKCDNVANQEASNSNSGLTAKASAGLSTPAQNQVFTAYSVYVTVASDSKHYVQLDGTANQIVGAISWEMKIRLNGNTLDYTNGHLATWNLGAAGSRKELANRSSAWPVSTGAHSASAHGWIIQEGSFPVGVDAPDHTHYFSVVAP